MAAVSKTGDASQFWNRILAHKTMPIVFDDTAMFFWRGDAKSVEWRGDFSDWQSIENAKGRILGSSDIWYMQATFPRAARLDYKLVIDGEDWILDPLNRHRQLGGYGPNSEVRMPDWKTPEHAVRRDGVVPGNFSADKQFNSAKLGYAVTYRIYTPAGINPSQAAGLPVLYVTDGSDYWHDEMGSLVIILDNLLANKSIRPIRVVFIDPWDRKANVNRRETEYIPTDDRECKFCEFMVEELIPEIEPLGNQPRSREGRGILGTSYGGLHAGFMAWRYGHLFEFVAMQSAAFSRAMWLLDEIGQSPSLPVKAFFHAGIFEPHILINSRKLRDVLQTRNVQVQYFEAPEGHSWGHWRAYLDDILIYFYG